MSNQNDSTVIEEAFIDELSHKEEVKSENQDVAPDEQTDDSDDSRDSIDVYMDHINLVNRTYLALNIATKSDNADWLPPLSTTNLIESMLLRFCACTVEEAKEGATTFQSQCLERRHVPQLTLDQVVELFDLPLGYAMDFVSAIKSVERHQYLMNLTDAELLEMYSQCLHLGVDNGDFEDISSPSKVQEKGNQKELSSLPPTLTINQEVVRYLDDEASCDTRALVGAIFAFLLYICLVYYLAFIRDFWPFG